MFWPLQHDTDMKGGPGGELNLFWNPPPAPAAAFST